MNITHETAILTNKIETVEFNTSHHRVHIPVEVASTNSRSKKTFEYTVFVSVELADWNEKPSATVYNAQGNMVTAAKFNHVREAAIARVNADMQVQLVPGQEVDQAIVNSLREQLNLA